MLNKHTDATENYFSSVKCVSFTCWCVFGACAKSLTSFWSVFEKFMRCWTIVFVCEHILICVCVCVCGFVYFKAQVCMLTFTFPFLLSTSSHSSPITLTHFHFHSLHFLVRKCLSCQMFPCEINKTNVWFYWPLLNCHNWYIQIYIFFKLPKCPFQFNTMGN